MLTILVRHAAYLSHHVRGALQIRVRLNSTRYTTVSYHLTSGHTQIVWQCITSGPPYSSSELVIGFSQQRYIIGPAEHIETLKLATNGYGRQASKAGSADCGRDTSRFQQPLAIAISNRSAGAHCQRGSRRLCFSYLLASTSYAHPWFIIPSIPISSTSYLIIRSPLQKSSSGGCRRDKKKKKS